MRDGKTVASNWVPGRVSICIPTHNRPGLLATLVKSILKQSYSNWEMIITDNSSDDDTSYLISTQFEDPRIIYRKNARNLGMDGNTVRALGYVSGEYFTFTPDDDIWIDPYKLEKQIQLLIAHPEVNCCFSNALHVNSNGVATAPFRSVYDGKNCRVIESSSLLLTERSVYFICILTGLIRSLYLEEFHKSWEFGSEEHFMWFLGGIGERIGFCRESLVAIRDSEHNWEIAGANGHLTNYRKDNWIRARQLADIFFDLSNRYGRRLVNFNLRTEIALFEILVRLLGLKAEKLKDRLPTLRKTWLLRIVIYPIAILRRRFSWLLSR